MLSLEFRLQMQSLKVEEKVEQNLELKINRQNWIMASESEP